MFDSLKKAFYAGIGVVSLSKDAAEKVINEWVERGKITREDAKDFFAKAGKLGEENWEKARSTFNEKAGVYGEKLPFVTREQFCELSQRVKALEEKLAIPSDCEFSEEKGDAVADEKIIPATDAEVVE